MIAIVGATGLVGRKIFEGLIDNGFYNLVLFASSKSNGKIMEYKGKKYTVYTLSQENVEIARPKYAIFSAGSKISKEWAKPFNKLGCVVIDNSSCFRKNKNVPLVAHGVNTQDIFLHKGIIANPNCSTLGVVPLLNTLKPYGLSRVVVTTMQSVSGAGKKGIDHLQNDIKHFDYPIKDNIIPQIGVFDKNNYSEEENKLINESRKILHNPFLNITATATRVPISFCHSESVNITLKKPLSYTQLIKLLSKTKNIVVEDLPMPYYTAEKTTIHIGRIRKDNSCKNSFNFFLTFDNLLRGAATNAIEILKEIYSE